jgi:hypothetical protein
MSDKYKAGLDLLAHIETADYEWALVKLGFPFNADHATVTDLELDLHEITRVGYARVALAGGTRTVNTSLNRIDYRSDWPVWTTPMESGETLGGAILYMKKTDDSDSIPVAYYPFEPIDSAVIAPFMLRFIDHLIGHTD